MQLAASGFMLVVMEALALPDEAATVELGAALARLCQSGDFIALSGELGVGKTTLARGLIRQLAGAATEVPSPSWLLVQTYETEAFPIWHIDLYRLSAPGQIEELGLEDAEEALVLLEWPEHGQEWLAPPSLHIVLERSDNGRKATLAGNEHWQQQWPPRQSS